MSLATLAPPTIVTFADLLEALGDIPPERIRMRPPTAHFALERWLIETVVVVKPLIRRDLQRFNRRVRIWGRR